MDTLNTQYTTTEYNREVSPSPASHFSAVSWGAIVAGAAGAAALSLILFLLGTGLGLSSVSPWSNAGVSGTTFGVTTILWITFTSLAASALGGYLAGRLRTRWTSTHLDEVHFRDTAHGFLAWALATLITATFLTSVISAIVGGAAQTGAMVAGGSAAAVTTTVATATNSNSKSGINTRESGDNKESDNKLLSYFTDLLFRTDIDTDAATNPDGAISTNDAPATGSSAAKAEVARIFVNGLAVGRLPTDDIRYASHVVAARTNLSPLEAEKRVTDTFNLLQTKLREAETAARDAADKARKASAYGSLWLFISLLIGAFIASLTAVYGGRQRDL